jgi:putative ABC transport system substrate-binding protein
VNRRAFIGTLASGLLAAPLAAEEQVGKTYRIGFLSFNRPPGDPIPPVYPFSAFRPALQKLGYLEGRNIIIEARWGDLRAERLPVLAEELVSHKVDVIVTAGDSEVRAAMQATHTIPIVMAVSGDPVGSGYVASLARPGGNVTGLTWLGPDLCAKQLEIVREAIPKARRVAVLWNKANPVKALDFKAAQRAAGGLGLKVLSLGIRDANGFDTAFMTLARERPDALLTISDEFMFHQSNRERIAKFLTDHPLPTMFGYRANVEEGGLMSYGASVHALFARAATYVDKILRGAKPADLPVEQPTAFELVINLRTAKALGLTIPQSLLVRADQVIE